LSPENRALSTKGGERPALRETKVSVKAKEREENTSEKKKINEKTLNLYQFPCARKKELKEGGGTGGVKNNNRRKNKPLFKRTGGGARVEGHSVGGGEGGGKSRNFKTGGK